MRGVRPRVSAWLGRPAGELEQRLLRTLTARFGLRRPFQDAPDFANPDDREAPPGLLNRSGMLATAFRFVLRNRVEGDYFEFGTYEGATFRLAHRHARDIVGRPLRFHLYDSFTGLPAPRGIDEGQWEAGAYAVSLSDFQAIVDRAGIPRDDYDVTPGFYAESLTAASAEALRAQGVRAAVVWVDCDLYESTRPVLAFVDRLLVPGAVLCFDDYFAFRGSPDRGEQRAVREWLAERSDLELVPYLNFGWHGKSFIVHLREADGDATSGAP